MSSFINRPFTLSFINRPLMSSFINRPFTLSFINRPLVVLLALCCVGCGIAAAQSPSPARLLGADLSMLPVYEKAGAVYKDASGGAQADPLLFFRDAAGVRCVRVRLFVEPSGETGVVQDLDFVRTFARRIKASGMKFMLDFHYSDTWADPAKQYIPRSWPTTAAGIEAKLYSYTTEVLQALAADGAAPDYIQVGNEISYGLCSMTGTFAAGKWTKTATPFAVYTNSDANWDTFRAFLASGIKACREQCPQAKLVIHTERAANWSTTRAIYQRLADLDFDIIGLSYYPFWHNSLQNLDAVLSNLAATFPAKEVMLVEFAYNNAWYPADAEYNFQSQYPATPAGQQKVTEDLIALLRRHDNVTGLFYWMPEENPAGNHVYEPWLNRGLFANGNASVGQSNANCALPAFYSLRKFTEGQPDAVGRIPYSPACPQPGAVASGLFDLAGRPLKHPRHGITVARGRKHLTL